MYKSLAKRILNLGQNSEVNIQQQKSDIYFNYTTVKTFNKLERNFNKTVYGTLYKIKTNNMFYDSIYIYTTLFDNYYFQQKYQKT